MIFSGNWRTAARELPFLKLYLCGGAPVPGYMVQKAWSFGILLCEVYGSTESVPVFVRPDEALELNGTTSGRPMEGVEIRVVDDETTCRREYREKSFQRSQCVCGIFKG